MPLLEKRKRQFVGSNFVFGKVDKALFRPFDEIRVSDT
jgi:hypothetical protein